MVSLVTNKGFLKTNTAVMWQLMRIAGMLEAEWVQVLWGSMSVGTKEDELSTGRFGVLDFTMLWPVLLGTRFETYELFFFKFQIFSGCGKPQITETVDTESADTGARLYPLFVNKV
jgi:hypothetical protein